jgi:Flp pilus assembly protein TadG
MCSPSYKNWCYLFFGRRGVQRGGIDPCLGSGAAPMPNARGLLKEVKATVAVEFAMIGAPLLLMILEIFQSALFIYFSGMLDHATQAAARQIMTGSVQKGSLTAAQFRTNLLCPLLPAAMACGNVVVNLQTFSEAAYPGGFNAFVNATQTAIIIPPLDNTKTSFCPGGSGEYVYFQVFYAMPLLGTVWLPAVTTVFNGQTVKLVSAAAAFKNEPYQGSYTPPPGC